MNQDLPPPFRGARPEILILDVDGVLTPNLVYLNDEGREWKPFFVPDGLGIRLVQRFGVPVAFVSGRKSDATRHRAEELDVKWLQTGVVDKASEVNRLLADLGVARQDAVFVGDDLIDLPAMRAVDLPVAVPNAHEEVRRVACAVTSEPGGKGAVREVCEWILKARGDWNRVLEGYES